ncbi:MAG TPA: hypothetical protein EYQ61_10670 [Dehalococcoidia bacterium]|nr:hypothetical protein [Dehalococcoidia bacterium]HIK89808.1 hypothetical protein [Dehalococcoidia bacterium]
MKRLLIVLLSVLGATVLAGCGDEGGVVRTMEASQNKTATAGGAASDQVDPSLLTPEGDGTFSMADTPTPVPSDSDTGTYVYSGTHANTCSHVLRNILG